MEDMMTFIQPFFDWLLQTTVIGSVVICLILAAQKTLGGKLGPRWCHALWLVLLLRMVLPWAPSSRLSLFNLVPSWHRQVQRLQVSETTERQGIHEPAQTAAASDRTETQVPESEAAIPDETAREPQVLGNVPSELGLLPISFRPVLPILWSVGAIVIGAYILVSDLALWRIVKRDRALVNQEMLELFEECKAQMDVQSLVVVVPSNEVRSPGLFGFVRPRLLLPREMLDTATREEMRYVFLHELAHLKRRDIYLGWLTSLLQILHWFNPLIWFAFYRMRTDRELACDALVLTRTGQEKSHEYGGAIVALLRRFSRSRRLPAMAGIIENRSQLKRRIAMITQFKNNSYQWSPMAVVLILFLACVSLPHAEDTKASENSVAKPETKTGLRQVSESGTTWWPTSISPNGRYVCDISYYDPNNAIAIRELSTGKRQFLVEQAQKGYRAHEPVMSPDGKTVAYYWYDGKEKNHQLQIINLDGSQRRIVQTGENIWPKDWSPDGKRILGIRFDEKDEPEFVWVTIEDGSVQSTPHVSQGPIYYHGVVDLSPDGRFVAYNVETPEPTGSAKYDLFVFSTETGHEVRVEDHPKAKLLGWAPDGQHILFTSERTGKCDAWLQPMADGKPQGQARLAYKNIDIGSPVGFTLNGDYYYNRSWYMGNVYTLGIDIKTGKVLEELKPVQPGLYGCPAWSPDGQHLAYCAKGPKNIHIRSLATGQERVLDPNLPPIRWLTWSPDGQSLLATHFSVRWPDQPLPRRVYKVDIKTGQSSVLMQSESRPWRAELSPDGKSLFYTSGWGSLLVRNLETDQEEKISEFQPAGLRCWDLSPDGKKVAIAHADPNSPSQLKIVTVENKQIRELLPRDWKPPHDEMEGFRCVAWSSDGKSVLLSIPKDYWHTVLWQIPIEGGEPREIFVTPKLGYWDSGLCVHPDGKRIVFNALGYQGGLWVMENFLPEAIGK
ncbi:MAG: hypothetical protein CEE38_00265 [Planctomycetes bacterium B3_Pla]|nr:MAG: hypothetical protein CEE38_00265 [Planctomycetes bacterium B3_Pla]